MFVLVFAFVFTICGAATAATPHTVTTINSHNDNLTVSTLQANSKKASKAKNTSPIADPIITGTVTINEYGHIRALKGATVTVNSTASNSKVLGTTKTDQNGYYSINFYSTDPQYRVTASYIGCNNITKTVTVSQGPNYPTDPNYYGTSNIELTPKTATLTGTGSGRNIYIQGGNKLGFAGIINVRVDGTTYQAYCIDLFTPISIGDTLLVNGPLPGTAGDLPSEVDWGKVTYVLNNYNPSSNDEAAAIQCAIWYFTSVHYGPYGGPNPVTGYYQFMTAPNDGRIDGAYGSTTVRTRAWEIINAAVSVKYPNSITLSPETTKISNGQSATVTATVKDHDGNPLQGITVNFQKDKGTLSQTSGITNALGQVSVTLSSIPNFSSAIVTAYVSGNYGNLLYDNQYTTRKQNLAARNLLPLTLSDISVINTDVTANVALSQTANSPVNVGDTVTYRVTATNNGPNAATGIMITDILPAGLTGFTVTPSVGTYYNNVWVIPSLANGATATLTITGTATASMAGTTTINTATETAQDQYISQLPTTTASVHVNQAGLTITNTGTTPVNVGDTGTFTITINNNGPDAATNIKINDIIPNGFTANTHGIGTYDGTTWTITSLASGATATLTFTKTNIPASMAGTTTTNTATATWNEYPKTVTIPNSNIHVKQANVALSQTVNTPVNVGDTVNYIITALNNGPDTATNININDIIPAGLIGAIITPSAGTTYSNGIWNIPSLAYLASATLNISGTAGSTMAGTTTTNTATRTSQTEYNNQPTATAANVYTKKADIKITNYTANGITTWSCYNTPALVSDVVNYGPDDATGVIAQYILPSGVKFISADTRGVGTYTYAYNTATGIGTITWTIGYMPNGGFGTIDVFALINKTGQLTTTAKVTHSDQYDPTPNPSKNYILTVPTSADIALTQTSSNNNPNTGDEITLTVNVTNNGPDNAAGVVITDTLPTGLEINLQKTNTHGIGTLTYDPTTRLLTWTIGQMNYGTLPAILDIVATVTTTDPIINNAIRNTPPQYDWNYNNNAQKVYLNTGTYVKQTDLKITNYNANGITTWSCYNTPTLVSDVVNYGPDDATGVIAQYILPSGVKFISADTRGVGTYTYAYNTATGIGTITWTIGYMPNGGFGTIDVFALINKTGQLTTTAKVTHSDQYDPTPNPSKNYILTVPTSADIALTQTSSNNNPNTGDEITLTVNVTNNGPDNAAGVVITDTLPTGLEINLQKTNTHGIGTLTYDPTTRLLTWTIGQMNYGTLPAILDIVATVTTTDPIINNAIRNTPPQYDWNYNNNAQKVYLPLNSFN
ncbi:Ig-like domain-containing protein [Methanobacterium spitsbergense]|uniref:DUF11 domain-containing protein n=1 Tax=Methanobacterium spitsbergense TaxID=2874285 RepID=A0A8T5V377_9EURY|nr:Ig-like domain-containing protein [Methanobacterium spitsbergense]MBZ2166321.1 DUF11 domain-containing protein [Methanobacterium spitsbergense]